LEYIRQSILIVRIFSGAKVRKPAKHQHDAACAHCLEELTPA
jgi:hypothetical protein